MNFNSLHFIAFFLIVFSLYWLLPQRARWVMLLIASYYFYMCWNALHALLIFGTTALSYAAGRGIGAAKGRAAGRAWLVCTLAVCLGMLAFFKYFNFAADSVLSLLGLFGLELSPLSLHILLPAGISFFTFQTLSYVIDVYRGTVPVERHFGHYALFVSFFPQLVAGPIERPQNLIPQLKATHDLCAEDLREGFKLLLSGYFRKVLAADFFGMFADAVYAAPGSANGPAVAVATVLFAAQIYCDFAGYSEIAAGCARLLGIRLMKNFDRPYAAAGIRDFWRRWHISLTGWFTDYLYIPLGGSRRGFARQCLATLIVFLVSGLWHGAAWTFVVWGCLHGVLMVLSLLLARLKRALGIPPGGRIRKGLARLGTLLLVCFAWIFFRAESLADAGTLVAGLFTAWDAGALPETFAALGMTAADAVQIVLLFVCLWLLPKLSAPAPARLPLAARTDVPTAAAFFPAAAVIAGWLFILSLGSSNAFIYFRF